jgi:hypothetical protein
MYPTILNSKDMPARGGGPKATASTKRRRLEKKNKAREPTQLSSRVGLMCWRNRYF